MTARRVPPAQAIVLAAALAGLTAALYWAYSTIYTELDLGWAWSATRLWLRGVDPYSAEATRALIPGADPAARAGFPYPFPLVLIMVPLALVPLAWASTAWALMSLASMAGLSRVAPGPLSPRLAVLPFLYLPFWAAMEQGQYAPPMVGLSVLSLHWLGSGRQRLAGLVLPLLLLKPQVGAPLLLAVAAYTLRRGAGRGWYEGLLLGGALWWGGSLIAAPGWPQGWLHQLSLYQGEGQNYALALHPLGAAMLAASLGLAALAWRRRDLGLLLGAVLVAGMIAVPMRSIYNQAVFAAPIVLLASRRPRAAAAAALLSWATFPLAAIAPSLEVLLLVALYAPPLALLGLAAAGPAERT